MPAVERNMIKHLVASGGGSLRAEANESFRVKDIFCYPHASDTYLTLLVDGRTVNKIRVKGKAGSHAPYPSALSDPTGREDMPFGLFSYLRAKGFDLTIPVPAGSALSVERYAAAGNVCLVYDRYPAGEVKGDEPNGPLGRLQRYLHYATNLDAVTATPASINSSLIWTGGDKWPFDGTAVPNEFKMVLHGIMACPMSQGAAGANVGYCTHVRMYREGDMLFDSRDQVGIPFLSSSGETGASPSYKPMASLIGSLAEDRMSQPFMLDPPLEFGPGEKLTTQVAIATASTIAFDALAMDFCFLLEKGPRTGR